MSALVSLPSSTSSSAEWVCICTRRNPSDATPNCKTCNKMKPSDAADMIVKAVLGKYSPAVIVRIMVEKDILHGLNSSTSTGILPLRIAIGAGRLDYVRAFVDAGALVNSSDRDGPLVNAAVDSEHPLSVEILRFLLSKGAGPIEELAGRVQPGSPNATSKRYWIDRAQHHLGFKLDVLNDYGFEDVSVLTLGMVGQPLALKWVVEEMATKLAVTTDRKPLVMVFGGYPGHGKTELSMLLAEMVATVEGSKAMDYIKIDCGLAKHDAEFFGHAGGYIGADRDTELNKFLREHDGKPGIVVLDEADKLDRPVWESLFAVLDRGNYKARLLGASNSDDDQTRNVSCSEIIWILTTNILDASIAEFEGKNRELIQMAARQMEVGRPGGMAADVLKSFQAYITPVFRSSFPDAVGPAINRRVDLFIPFFTFKGLECYVLAEGEVNQMAVTLREPPSNKKEQVRGKKLADDTQAIRKKPIGNISLYVADRAVETLAKSYDPMGGASSIKKAVQMAVVAPIVSMQLSGELAIPTDADADPVPLWLCTAVRNKEEHVDVRLMPPPPVLPQIEEEAMPAKPAHATEEFEDIFAMLAQQPMP